MSFTIFCHLKTPEAALEYLKDHKAIINTSGENWNATFSFPASFIKREKNITFKYNREWCSSPNWDEQSSGMQSYLKKWKVEAPLLKKLTQLASQFTFCLGITTNSKLKDGNDPRLEIISALTENLGGIIFTPNAFLDHHFRLISSAEGKKDKDAHFPELRE